MPTGYSSREDYQTKARAALQRVDALITRRRVIKRAIVLSNAAVTVTVAKESCKNKFGLFELILESPRLSVGLRLPNLFLNRHNEEMTVAEAIEMKNFIAYYEEVLNTMHNAHKETLAQYERAKTKVKERLDKLALEVLGKNVNVSDNRYQSLADSFLAREGLELLDPTNLAEEIARRQNFIEEFKSTVDRVLSISNAYLD